jgi:hypothetical protein
MYRRRLIIVIVILGMLGTAMASGSREAPMTFSLHQECEGSLCDTYILAQGIITVDTPQRFQAFVAKLRFKLTIYFDSPGGNLAAGIQLGYLIRQAKLDTFVGGPYTELVKVGQPYKTLVDNGICFSACAYAFLGGQIRELHEDGRYAVHQFYGRRKDAGESAAQVTTAVLAQYLDDMGVDRRLLDLASLTDTSTMQTISPSIARELNIDNTVPPKSEWELKATDSGNLYMFVVQRQERRDGLTHVSIWREGKFYIAVLYHQIRQNFRSREVMDELFLKSGKATIVVNNKEVIVKAQSP